MTEDDRSPAVLAVATLFFILSWVTVGLRVYVRGFLMKTWGKDDSCMVATLVVFTVFLPCQIVAAIHGTGRHRWELSDSDARTALMFTYLCEILYVLANCLLKFAIGYFYLRVATERWHIWTIRFLMAGTVLGGLTYLFLVVVQCIPISEFWDHHPASDKCIAKAATLGFTYALAAANALADWALALLPLFIIRGLGMKRRTKFLVACILAFASIGSTGTIIRMAYVHTLTDGPDFLYSTTDIALWSTIEPGIGITAGSIATLRPLVHYCLWWMGLANTPPESRRRDRTYYPSYSERKRNGRRGYRRSLSPSDLVLTELGTSRSVQICGPHDTDYVNTVFPPKIVVTDTDASSTPEGHIIPNLTMDQQYEGPPKLQLRDSFRNSFTGGAMLSMSKFRTPD
ncbi:hypothetical protein BDW02DRAFT_372147 [Decorospora gaudefroyi]|uniref:Rhodopsin domain-containing protein n=1 Tax=Decorospora gaudefroyi TaxID=184978 RepID=A0A6A5KJR5_9PLEO|nr:hypothetical protein BDW02DRAFT_372147 [Decorospora gaudefroyi]